MPHYYLTDWHGTGSALDPYTPVGADGPGWGVIDLRPDATDPTGPALLALPEHRVIPGALYLGDAALRHDARIAPTVRRRLESRLSLTLGRDRFPRAVLELLTEHARWGRRRWNPLAPTTAGAWEVYLGGPLIRLGLAGGATYTEDWNAADSSSLNADLTWTEVTGTAWGITSNQARFAGNVAVNHARAEHDLDSADHTNEATLVTFTYSGNALDVGISCRFASAADTAYIFVAQRTPTTNEHILRKRVTGTNTTLGTHPQDAGTGVVLKIEANGSAIKGYRAGSELVSVTDTAIAGGTRFGIYGASTNASNVGVLDDLSATDLAAAPAGATPLRMLLGIGT